MLHCISNLIGIPFVNRGRDKTGCDCWGLVKLVYREFGIELPEYNIDCHSTALIHMSISEAQRKWKRVKEPQVPCVVIMRLDAEHPRAISHTGVYVGEGKFLHTIQKQNSKLERLDHPFFKNIIAGYYVYEE